MSTHLLSSSVPAEWFRLFRPNPSAVVRLLCFTPVGGSASLYSHWGRDWPMVEVHALQAPGRETRIRERPLTRMEDLVDGIIANLPYDKPFAFFGHSLGGTVAYEAACRLREQGRRLPVFLFISASPAPAVARDRRNRHLLSEPEMLDYLRFLGGTPEEVLSNREIMALALPVLRADFEVADTYTYTRRSPLSIPISVFGGMQDAEVRENELAAWRFHAGGPFRKKMFAGDHFYLKVLEQALTDEIQKDLISNDLISSDHQEDLSR